MYNESPAASFPFAFLPHPKPCIGAIALHWVYLGIGIGIRKCKCRKFRKLPVASCQLPSRTPDGGISKHIWSGRSTPRLKGRVFASWWRIGVPFGSLSRPPTHPARPHTHVTHVTHPRRSVPYHLPGDRVRARGARIGVLVVAIRHMISIFAAEERTRLSCLFLVFVRVRSEWAVLKQHVACGNGAAFLALYGDLC
jgi:hypothetical protein